MNHHEPATLDWADEFFDTQSTAKKPLSRRSWFPWIVILAILAILTCIFSPFVIVTNGHRGIATFFGDLEGDVYTEGIHLKYPLLRVHQFDVRTQSRELSTGVVTKDLQLVTLTVNVNYSLAEESVKDTYREYGVAYEEILLDPLVKEALSVAATKFTASELMHKRSDFTASVTAELTNRLVDTGLSSEGVAIVQLTFSKALQEAYESAAIAQAHADAASLEARAAADKAEAVDSLIDLDTKRIQTIGDALRGNEVYLQYEILEKWDGKTPLYLAPLPTTPEDSNRK